MTVIAGGSVSVSSIVLGGVLGAAAGGLLSLLLRRSWGAGIALFDALLAVLSAVAVAYAVMELDKYGSAPYSPASFVLPVAVGIVVVRHLARLTF